MTTRPTILILAACCCLGARGANVFADDNKTATAKSAPSTDAGKVKALDEMAALGPKAADKIKLIEGDLKDPSPVVRDHAALALGAIGPAAKEAAPALAELIKDPDASVRRCTVRALREIHPGPQVMIPLCTKMLADADPMIRARILNTIADAGKQAVPGLIEALKDPKACLWALVVLRDIGPDAGEAVPAIVEVLKDDKRRDVRCEAVLTLAALGKAADAALPELGKLASDETSCVPATFAMGELGQIPKDAEAKVRANAKSGNSMLSAISLWALARVHPDDKDLRREATEKLIEGMKDKDPFVRAAAARALAALPPAPEITGPIWEKAMKDADETVMHNALDAIAALGPQAVPRLIGALKKYDKFRAEIIYTLGRIGPAAAPATPELAKFIEDKHSRVANEAIIALGKIGPGAKEAVPALVKALSQPVDKDMNFTAIAFALGKIGPAAAAGDATLEDKLSSKNDNVRVMSGWALAQISGSSTEVAAKAVPVLTAALSSSDEVDRMFAAEALGGFGPLAKDAGDALKKATGDADKNVSEAAAAALKAVSQPAPAAAQSPAAAPAAPTAPASPASPLYKPGDQAVTVMDDVEIGVAGKQGQIVPKGTKLKVLEIRGSWIGVRAEIDGKTFNGWLLGEQIGKP